MHLATATSSPDAETPCTLPSLSTVSETLTFDARLLLGLRSQHVRRIAPDAWNTMTWTCPDEKHWPGAFGASPAASSLGATLGSCVSECRSERPGGGGRRRARGGPLRPRAWRRPPLASRGRWRRSAGADPEWPERGSPSGAGSEAAGVSADGADAAPGCGAGWSSAGIRSDADGNPEGHDRSHHSRWPPTESVFCCEARSRAESVSRKRTWATPSRRASEGGPGTIAGDGAERGAAERIRGTHRRGRGVSSRSAVARRDVMGTTLLRAAGAVAIGATGATARERAGRPAAVPWGSRVSLP